MYLYQGIYYSIFLTEKPDQQATIFDYLYNHPMYSIVSNETHIPISEQNFSSIYVQVTTTNIVSLSEYDYNFQKEQIINLSFTQYNTIEGIPSSRQNLKDFCL